MGLVIKLAVNLDLHWARAMGALGLNLDFKALVAQFPLHEGRRKCVCRSGRVQFFARIEGDPVRCFVDSDRIGPGYVTILIPV